MDSPPDLLRAEARAAAVLLLLASCWLGLQALQPVPVLRWRPLRVDVNRARLDELTALPGVGRRTAARLVRSRPHQDFSRVARILGPRRWRALRPYLRLETEPEVDVNHARPGG